MRTLFKSDFFWQFVGGFALGAVGVTGLHLADLAKNPTEMVASAASLTR